ncbi:MAG TPA: pseudouridine-5'-phosphate glycosidase [Gaiellales bacterium]|nr:pseudouridine-5'-phosphate glycosidase [Gaiellales bacterium]
MTRHPSGLLRISPEVEAALVRSQPVVALESSLISHGLPPDVGPDVGRAAEERVRERGAVPATIAVVGGTVRVGIDDEVVSRLAVEPNVRKVGPRDLATCAVSGTWGATTVAGTLAVCSVAGIHFMATGGIGGVHRGWADTRDVSADLDEIARTPVCVVCSGAKSLLDIPATLEALETSGVPLVGFRTDVFPLFYVRESPFPVPDRADDPDAIAAAAAAHWGFGRTTGLVVAQPVAEEAALDAADLERTIEAAVAGAAAEGVRGPAVTPHVLAAVHAATAGRSLEANTRLVVDNAGLAAEIAVAYYR